MIFSNSGKFLLTFCARRLSASSSRFLLICSITELRARGVPGCAFIESIRADMVHFFPSISETARFFSPGVKFFDQLESRVVRDESTRDIKIFTADWMI